MKCGRHRSTVTTLADDESEAAHGVLAPAWSERRSEFGKPDPLHFVSAARADGTAKKSEARSRWTTRIDHTAP